MQRKGRRIEEEKRGERREEIGEKEVGKREDGIPRYRGDRGGNIQRREREGTRERKREREREKKWARDWGRRRGRERE